MTRVAYKFQPIRGSSFHFGLEGLDYETSAETFPSDSMFSALISAMVESAGSDGASALLADWPAGAVVGPESPAFMVSSVFPYAGDLLLFPMPRIRVILNEETFRGATKFLKKVKYVSQDILMRLLTNQNMTDWLPEARKNGFCLQDGKIWLSQDDRTKLPSKWRNDSDSAQEHRSVWKLGTAPHVTVDRTSNSGSIYLVGRTVFAEECGLWMLADAAKHKDILEDLLYKLQDKGIGGRRSTGHGAFTILPLEKIPELPGAIGSPRVMTLSRYSPTAAELASGVLGPDASYELVDVGGWLWSPENPAQRRKRVRMIEAGSILEAPVPITGRLVDVRPEYDQPGAPQHPVYRCGVALTIGVAAAQGD